MVETNNQGAFDESSSPVKTDAFPHRRLTLSLALFSALSAIAGGIALAASFTGGRYLPPVGVLTHSPFTTFLFPGLILALVVGGASLWSAFLLHRRSPWATDVTIFAGGVLTFWIVAEVAILRGVHWLHAVYGALGLSILVLGLLAARMQGHPRHRWVTLVTSAESLAYLVPAVTAILLTRAGVSHSWFVGGVLVAGLVEGAVLGAGQARAFPFPVREGRFIALTALGAGIAWASSFAVVALVSWDRAPSFVTGAFAVTLGFLAVFGIGSVQWLELRRHSTWAYQWIAWSALAWVLALPLSFLAGPFVDEQTPLWAHLVLWPTAGVLMAYVMALVTWQGVRRMPPVIISQEAERSPTTRKPAFGRRPIRTSSAHS